MDARVQRLGFPSASPLEILIRADIDLLGLWLAIACSPSSHVLLTPPVFLSSNSPFFDSSELGGVGTAATLAQRHEIAKEVKMKVFMVARSG